MRSTSCAAARRWRGAWAGPDKIKRQRDGGKLTVRERIDRLLDKDSFHEIGAIAGKAEYDADGTLIDFTASNFVMGRGRIDGRPVAVGGDDFTVRGGAADASIWEKQEISEQMAGELGIPMVRLVDGTGGGGSVKTYETTGYTYVPRNPGWEHVVDNLARVPVVALGLGSVAGLGAARLVTSHYSLMVTGISQMFVAGPPVVARLGEKVTKEELGGTEIHARNGAVDDEVESEDEAFARTRRFLSYLPSSIDGVADRQPSNDDPNRREASLIEAIPRDRRKVYRVRPIVEACVDRGSLLRDRQDVGPLGRHRPRPGRRLAGRGAGERSVLLWRRLDDRCQPQGHALRRLRRDLPSAGGALRRHPGLRDRRRGREGRHHPARRAGAGRGLPEQGAVVLDPAAQVVRRRGRGAPELAEVQFPLRLAVGRLGLAAARGRHRGRLQGRARGRRPIRPRISPRSRRGSTRCARRSAPPSASASRRSSTRATPASCCASSPISPRPCASPARAASDIGRSAHAMLFRTASLRLARWHSSEPEARVRKS